jgi:TonB family protein
MLALRVAIGFAVFASAQSMAVAASAPPQLRSSKPWVLDYDETQCLAGREYGPKDDPITFVIRPAPNAQTYEFLIGRHRGGPRYDEELEGSVDFGSGPIKAWLLVYGTKAKQKVQQFRISALDMEQARSATSVTFIATGGEDVSLALTDMPALLKGLKDCTADLQQYWNMDFKTMGKAAAPSKGHLRGLFTTNDFPAEAQTRGQEGTAQFLLLIDEKGKVAACHVQKTSGVPVFDAMGCDVIVERAKFTPALDAQGHPVRSTVVTPPITWLLGR